LAFAVTGVLLWKHTNFGNLSPGNIMRITIPSLVLITCGIELVFSSFFIGVLNVKKRS
jgi:hypothetical protein